MVLIQYNLLPGVVKRKGLLASGQLNAFGGAKESRMVSAPSIL